MASLSYFKVNGIVKLMLCLMKGHDCRATPTVDVVHRVCADPESPPPPKLVTWLVGRDPVPCALGGIMARVVSPGDDHFSQDY